MDNLTRQLDIADAEKINLQEIADQRDSLLTELQEMKNQNDLFNQAVESLRADLIARYKDKEAIDIKHRQEVQILFNKLKKMDERLEALQKEFLELQKENSDLRTTNKNLQ